VVHVEMAIGLLLIIISLIEMIFVIRIVQANMPR
jgi:hypothetical protein